ncbi:uncharacterized protein LOC130821016 [Amaranthus tricolor]|uniref:uncharacterized protein LOC130821016 n=1 Tax=Amaranthus tricolor TaxID=29722 RepID=UPI00258C1209|nr:uncharacterized protein LOC130821016 [Amaranthus tricolor]
MEFQNKVTDKEQDDLQFLGFFGIIKESIKIILIWSKIFIQITLAFILPNSCLFLANNWVSMLLLSKITPNSSSLPNHQVGFSTYNNFSNSMNSEQTTLWIIKLLYMIVSTIFSLFIVSAIVYTVACIYTRKSITFRKVVSVVPKVWKRLMITFLCNFCIVFACMFVFIIIVCIFLFIYTMFLIQKVTSGQVGIYVVLAILTLLFMVGFFYMVMVWQLANVISVMENEYGFKALKKSKKLIKGKLGIAFSILVAINICGILISEMSKKFAGVGLVVKLSYGIPSVVLWSLLTLFSVVIQTIFYLVCKSYHHESIDKSMLADHLNVYLGEYIPLKNEDIQLERFQV